MPTPPLVGGRRLLTTTAASAGAASAITWFALHGLMPSANAALITQLVTAIVYATLLASFVVSFSPLKGPPLDLKSTSAKDSRAPLFMVLMPLQFIRNIRERYLTWHRWSGRLLVILGFVVGTSALVMSYAMAIGGADWRRQRHRCDNALRSPLPCYSHPRVLEHPSATHRPAPRMDDPGLWRRSRNRDDAPHRRRVLCCAKTFAA
jgi:hypothetical protein